MSHKLLQIRLEVIDCCVLYQILEQDAHIKRGIGDIFMASNGWNIQTEQLPEITPLHIYLRGNDTDQDYLPTLYKTVHQERAIEMKTEILFALEEYATSLSHRKETPDIDTYTFYLS